MCTLYGESATISRYIKATDDNARILTDCAECSSTRKPYKKQRSALSPQSPDTEQRQSAEKVDLIDSPRNLRLEKETKVTRRGGGSWPYCKYYSTVYTKLAIPDLLVLFPEKLLQLW
jgi:hypothetical protein